MLALTRINGSFVILDYGDDTKVVHLENKTINLFLDEEGDIEEYLRTWAELQKLSYNAERSVKLISAIATQADRKN